MSKDFELDHIGIAVASLANGKAFYEALGLGPMATESVPTEQVNVGIFELDNKARLELLEPMAADSPVGKFLAKRGPGVHHVCLRVSDLPATLRMLKARGVKLINDEPRPGAHGALVAFVHPSSTGGVLLELSQPGASK